MKHLKGALLALASGLILAVCIFSGYQCYIGNRSDAMQLAFGLSLLPATIVLIMLVWFILPHYSTVLDKKARAAINKKCPKLAEGYRHFTGGLVEVVAELLVIVVGLTFLAYGFSLGASFINWFLAAFGVGGVVMLIVFFLL